MPVVYRDKNNTLVEILKRGNAFRYASYAPNASNCVEQLSEKKEGTFVKLSLVC